MESDDASILAEVRRRLPLKWGTAPLAAVDRAYLLSQRDGGETPGGRAGVLRVNDRVLVASADARHLVEMLAADLQGYVARMARHRVFIHAGVVGWRGSAIVLPGRSFWGKTRLVMALLRSGADYYSDEYAVLDATGQVHPFQRLLSVRQDDGTPPRRDSAEDLGGRCGTGPLPVGLVAVSIYEPGARWLPRRLSTGEAVLALLTHSISVRREPARVLDTLTRVASQAPVLSGTRGEAYETVAPLLSMLSLGRI